MSRHAVTIKRGGVDLDSQNDRRGRHGCADGCVCTQAPIWPSLGFLLLQDVRSVGGNPSRPHSPRSVANISQCIWTERWWTTLQLDVNADWSKNGNRGTSEFEIGHRLDSHWRVCLRPGIGLWGQDIANSYDRNFQFECDGCLTLHFTLF